MILFKKVDDLRRYLSDERENGKKIGFVPTMGALHTGHISLVELSNKKADLTVCSIFVNPTQFNESTDLKNYPRTPEPDIEKLVDSGCHILFMPPVEEVYPQNYKAAQTFDFGDLDKPMEGVERPGHFQGMAQVVYRLLQIVEPNSLYMGQKDYQQFAIVQEMLKQMGSDIELVIGPTVREIDGVAMSSRNMRLNKNQRSIAPNIYRTLMAVKDKMDQFLPKELEKMAIEMLSNQGMELEYFEIVDGTTLTPIASFDESEKVVACTAVRVGEIRLIDNFILKS